MPGLRLFDRLKISYRPYICPFEELLAEIAPSDWLFDIGCGSGQFALLAEKFRHPRRITGIEVDPRLIANARTLFQRATGLNARQEFSVYNGHDFPASLGDADLVTLIDVIHHVPPAQQAGFVRAIFAAMKPGARLLLKDIDAASPLVFVNRLHDRLFSGAPGHEIALEDMTALTLTAGFVVQRAFRCPRAGYPHYLCVLTKPLSVP